MQTKLLIRAAEWAALLLLSPLAVAQTPLGTAFTYQGQLKSAGSPVNAAADFEFSLWDSPDADCTTPDGTQLGATQAVGNVTVISGLFTVQLNGGGQFGAGAFDGNARWLQIAVRSPAGGGAFTTLCPRQALTPAPHALALPGLYTQQNPTSPNLIGGHSGNSVAADVVGATIGGGGDRTNGLNRVTCNFGTVSGGQANQAGDNAGGAVASHFCTIGGGAGNTASGDSCTVGGGVENTANGPGSSVGGGLGNTATTFATVAGGYGNSAINVGTVSGGGDNAASGGASTVGGGQDNFANGNSCTIGGGSGNTAMADYATIAGGGLSNPLDPSTRNRVTDDYGTIGGGGNNQAGDNAGTATDSAYATVAGGASNTASGLDSSVPGGINNLAGGDYSFAAGRRAKVRTPALVGGGDVDGDQGTFVWADSTDADFTSSGPNQFLIRAAGGVGINISRPEGFALAVDGPVATPGGGSWSVFSDARLKTNVAPLSGTLDRLLALRGYEFEYTPEALEKDLGLPGRQIGLMAQEVQSVFPDWVGRSDDGYLHVTERATTALMVEALRDLRAEKDKENEALRQENADLRARLDRLEQALRAVSK